MRIREILAAAVLLAGFPALAQTESGETEAPRKRVIYKAVEEITFKEVEINGENRKVPGILFLSREDQKYPSMIDERAHFKRDLAKSIGLEITKTAKSSE